MSMTYLQFKNIALKLLNRYSARGTELDPTKTADIRLKIQDFINAELMDLASTTGKIAAVSTFVHKPFYNELSRDTSAIKQHVPGTDFAVELVGAKAYWFECVGPATITVDEETSADVWTNLTTITVASTVTTFTAYKGLITASDATNAVRLNFSGSYLYPFRNYVLYPYTFETEAAIQQHRPRFIYSLPTDFLKMNNLVVRKETRQEVPEVNFTLDMANKTISINRYVEGEYIINYYRKPTYITITGVDATDDAQIVDVNEDAAYVLALGVASIVVAKQDPATSVLLNNLYESKKANLTGNDGVYVQSQVPLSGW